MDRREARSIPVVAPKVVKAKTERELDAEIDRLYGEIRELVARVNQEPCLVDEICRRQGELLKLQELEAAEIRERLVASRHLPPGSGWQLLAEIDNRLANA